MVGQAPRASGRPLAQLTAQAACPALRALLVLHLLLVDYLGKVAAAVAVVLLAQAAQAVLEVVALVEAAVELVALHTQPAPVV